MDSMADHDELRALRAENGRLIAAARIARHRMACAARPTSSPVEPARLSAEEGLALPTAFSAVARTPTRSDGKARPRANPDYARPVQTEWRAGVCEKPRIKCGDCANRLLIPLSDAVIYDHLAGEHTVGVYPLLEDDTCYFLAVDFDESCLAR